MRSTFRNRYPWPLLGSFSAFGLSYITNHSFWWALLSAFLEYFYCAYWIIKHVAIRFV